MRSVEFRGSPVELGPGCFNGCNILAEITLPDSIQIICEQAFSGCTGLEKIDLGNGLQSIEDYAFENCQSLKHICIPPTCIRISPLSMYQSSIQTMELPAPGNIEDLRFVTRLYSLRQITCPPSMSSNTRLRLDKLGCAGRVLVGKPGSSKVENNNARPTKGACACCMAK